METEVAAAARAEHVNLVDLHRARPDDLIHLNLLIPIAVPGEAGQSLGLLDLRIDPRRQFFPLVNRGPTASQSAETVLLRREGQEAVVLNELRLDRLAALTRCIPLSRTDVPAIQAVLGSTEIVHGVEYDGIEALAGVLGIPDTPWFLEARVSREEILEPPGARLRNLAALVGVLLLATGTGAGWIWRQQQLQHLRDRADLQSQSEARYRGALDNMLEGAQIIGFELAPPAPERRRRSLRAPGQGRTARPHGDGEVSGDRGHPDV